MKRKKLLITAGLLLIAAFVVLLAVRARTPDNTATPLVPAAPGNAAIRAQNLEVPWNIARLPDGRTLVTERPGRLRLIGADGKLRPEPVAVLPDVRAEGEGGLLGTAVHPDYESNGYLYLYYTYGGKDDATLNRVVRYRFEGASLTGRQVIIDAIPGARIHNGGRIAFGPDNFLYVATGDAAAPSQAQDQGSLAGKILRVTEEGAPAPGNPFGSRIYSYGHRNPQGLAWDEEGQLWATEHGPRGRDEINRVQLGANYGWPEITGDETREGMISPARHSGLGTWAPSGAAFSGGKLYFGGLRGRALFGYDPKNNSLEERLEGEYGRIRAVEAGPDGLLYLSTSNRDGRGDPGPGDDRIITVNSKDEKTP